MNTSLKTAVITVATAAMLSSGVGMALAAKAPAPAPAPAGGGGKVPPPPAPGGGGKVPPPPVAGGGGGGKVPPPPVPGGGGGGGGVPVVLPPPPPPVAVGGGAGTLNSLLTPTAPFGALNEDPTLAGAPAASVATMRFTPARSNISVSLANMDTARFPLVGCTVSGTVNGAPVIGAMAASVAPSVGNTASTKVTATSGAGATATLDVVCNFVTRAGAQHHETHWTGALP